MKKYNIAICGATGLVGRKIIQILEEYNIPIQNLYLFASDKSNGKTIVFKGKNIIVSTLNKNNISNKKIDFALFSAGSTISKEWIKEFTNGGTIVIDNSSAFRMSTDIPLIVPEINAQDIKKTNKLIANPNCSTIQCMLPLKVLNDLYALKSLNFVTFQAVSGSGKKGIEDLENTAIGLPNSFYPYKIYNNCIPQIGAFLNNGYTEEELKMVNETKKILHLKDVSITATCVRVPVFNSHMISVSAKFKNKINIKETINALESLNGIVVVDDTSKNIYPLQELSNNNDSVFIGRIRKDLFDENTIHFICSADNIRKGAASNAVQILQYIIKKDKG